MASRADVLEPSDSSTRSCFEPCDGSAMAPPLLRPASITRALCSGIHGQITHRPDSLDLPCRAAAANRVHVQMVDILAAPRQAKTDSSLRTLIAISTAHWVSHFHLMVLPMLFPFLKEQLGVGYIELGFALTVFAVVSGLTQAPIGYLADRIGARKILLAGLTLGGAALIMLGLHLSYASLIASAVLLGLANSVYHPADYAILSAHMDEARMGRAFSIHPFAGFLGGAVAPAIVAALVAVSGGYGGLIVAGAVGPVVALLLLAVGIPDACTADRGADGARAPQPNVVTP